MLMHVQHGILTLGPDEPIGGVETVHMSTDSLLIKVVKWHFDMFTVSCKIDEKSKAPCHEIFCYAADQIARNKWLAVFRRMGVTIVATRVPHQQSAGSCPDLEVLHHLDIVTVRMPSSCNDLFLEGNSQGKENSTHDDRVDPGCAPEYKKDSFRRRPGFESQKLARNESETRRRQVSFLL